MVSRKPHEPGQWRKLPNTFLSGKSSDGDLDEEKKEENRMYVTRVGQLAAQITAKPAVLTDILAEEDHVKINASPNYEDDVMNIMLISGNFDGGKVLATPKS